jgi:hypothetical protein
VTRWGCGHGCTLTRNDVQPAIGCRWIALLIS